MLLAAPFDTPGVAGAEELVRRFVLLVTGRPQDQLDEHRDHGLPGVDDTSAHFAALGLQVAVAGAGNLHDWLAMMLLKHQLVARPALGPLDTGYDIAYNWLFSGRDHVPPFYRHLVAAGRTLAPLFGDVDAVLDHVVGATTVAGAAGRVHRGQRGRGRPPGHQRPVGGHRSPGGRRRRPAWPPSRTRVARLDARSQATATSIEPLLHLVRHPVASAVDKVRRGLPGTRKT